MDGLLHSTVETGLLVKVLLVQKYKWDLPGEILQKSSVHMCVLNASDGYSKRTR